MTVTKTTLAATLNIKPSQVTKLAAQIHSVDGLEHPFNYEDKHVRAIGLFSYTTLIGFIQAGRGFIYNPKISVTTSCHVGKLVRLYPSLNLVDIDTFARELESLAARPSILDFEPLPVPIKRLINIDCRSWYDKTHGNTYTSGVVYINNTLYKVYPMQLGSSYALEVQAIADLGLIESRSLRDKGIHVTTLTRTVTKAECRAFGKG